MQRTLLEEGAQTIMRAVKLAANEVAVAVEGDINKWNLDTPSLRIENIAGSGSNYDKLGRDYGAISEYQSLVRFLKAHNYIQDFVSTKPKSVDDIMKKVHKQYKASLPSKYSKDYDIVWDTKVRPFLMHEFPDS